MVPSDIPNERWDRAMDCYHHFRNVQDKMVNDSTAYGNKFGVQLAGPLFPFEAKVSYRPISLQDEAKIFIKLAKKRPPRIFVGSVLCAVWRMVRRFPYRG